MSSLNTVQFDKARIRHLLKLGIFAACMVMLGDILLGWGVSDPDVTEIPAVFTRYLSVSDARIIASALLGLIGIPIECLCWFAVCRMIRPYSESDAHLYRGGIIGCLAFGGCGVHVPCCMAVYLLKRVYAADPSSVYGEMLQWIGWFLMPDPVPAVDTYIEYWYGEGEKHARAKNCAYVKRVYPQTVSREFRGLMHAELVLMYPKLFREEILRVWNQKRRI